MLIVHNEHGAAAVPGWIEAAFMREYQDRSNRRACARDVNLSDGRQIGGSMIQTLRRT
jgi:hypothetical protein